MWDVLVFPKFLPNMVLDNSCDCNYVSTVFFRHIFRYVRLTILGGCFKCFALYGYFQEDVHFDYSFSIIEI